ncbi:MAG: hypothetical protein WD118_04080, partial [Phycisphaeraceae bacterium]
MVSAIRRKDEATQRIEAVLKRHFPGGEPEAYRYGDYSHVIRLRVIDRSFDGKPWIERHECVERYLADLPDDLRADITMLVLVTPDELKDSMVNREFENPSRSLL